MRHFGAMSLDRRAAPWFYMSLDRLVAPWALQLADVQVLSMDDLIHLRTMFAVREQASAGGLGELCMEGGPCHIPSRVSDSL